MDDLTMARDAAEVRPEEEARLVEAARRDPVAFSLLYRRYVTPVYRYLYKRLGNAKDAEDLTSQVFTEALEGLAHYRERGNFVAWLFTIARRKAVDAYRRRRPTLSLEDVEELHGSSEDPLEQLVQEEELERIAALFVELEEDQRELLRLRFSAGLTYADIGAVLGRSASAVKMAIHRLLRQLYEKWEGK
jgi:RNA polymerase sigma-70 factor (ECF subfamily)